MQVVVVGGLITLPRPTTSQNVRSLLTFLSFQVGSIHKVVAPRLGFVVTFAAAKW